MVTVTEDQLLTGNLPKIPTAVTTSPNYLIMPGGEKYIPIDLFSHLIMGFLLIFYILVHPLKTRELGLSSMPENIIITR